MTEYDARVLAAFNDMGKNPQDESKLDWALRLYVRDASFGRILNHPLVQQVPFYSWKIANASLEAKLKVLREREAKGEWMGAMGLYEKPYRLDYLWGVRKRMDKDTYRSCLTEAWMMCEWPHQYGKARLRRMFQYGGFTTDLHRFGDDPPEGWTDEDARPQQVFTVYRGVGKAKKFMMGFSWTKSPSIAEWFAGRLGKRGTVYAAECPPEAALGIFVHRGEDEVVCDPNKLLNIRVVQTDVGEVKRKAD